ncbi:hypothetical protein ACFQ36_04220 [Arthrobacter sp. GCM10027362]|uniref:hypothetical protein n=1 Tax=Arthrobacter sp. GCM10027362 TaxID=3273379 RepID=UPI00362A381F
MALIWTLAIAAGAALIWRLTHRSADSTAAGAPGAAAPGPGGTPAAVTAGGTPLNGASSGSTSLLEAVPRPAGAAAAPAEEEPIDGWTQSAADTAASEPPVEDQYIEDISVAPHATPLDPGSEPSPWLIRMTTPASPAEPPARRRRPETAPTKGTDMQDRTSSEGTAADEPGLHQDTLYDESEWAGDDSERLVDPEAGEAGPRGQ